MGGGLGMGMGGGYEEGEDGAEASLGSQEKGGGRLLPTRCGGHERLTGASDLFVDTCAAASASDAIFVVHSHFGHEELGSLLRLELCTPVALVPLMEWLRTAPSDFSARQAWRDGGCRAANLGTARLLRLCVRPLDNLVRRGAAHRLYTVLLSCQPLRMDGMGSGTQHTGFLNAEHGWMPPKRC
jgi:hypothetical protein